MSGRRKIPERRPPSDEWEYCELWKRVNNALKEVHRHFRSTITVSGITVTEIYTFSEALSATVENEFVRNLNDIREVWDPENRYPLHHFIRYPSFPDVLLSDESKENIIMGIELKSWYLLAKEGEPSFRFRVTPRACAEFDLLVVFPWVLSNVISGTPIIFEPYLDLARYVAEYRNYWWQHLRRARGDIRIKSPETVHPYPEPRERFDDEPYEDSGRNFGRIARIEIMDEYVRSLDEVSLLGIETRYWREFFKTGGKAFKEQCGKQLKLLN